MTARLRVAVVAARFGMQAPFVQSALLDDVAGCHAEAAVWAKHLVLPSRDASLMAWGATSTASQLA
jgi:hypothetical protein